MRTADEWFVEYGESHQNPTNKTLHWICIPLIVFSLLGMLWSIPTPAFLTEISPWLNWATLFMGAAMVWYLLISIPLALGMTVLAGAMVYGNSTLWQLSLAIFVVAWIGQFIGHKIEGKKPSFFKDLQFLLIGPLWLLGFIYRRLGIGY